MASERIRQEGPVENTVHNLIQTLSVKLDSAARYGLYQEDAQQDGAQDCVEVFQQLAEQDQEAIQRLMTCLQSRLGQEQSQK